MRGVGSAGKRRCEIDEVFECDETSSRSVTGSECESEDFFAEFLEAREPQELPTKKPRKTYRQRIEGSQSREPFDCDAIRNSNRTGFYSFVITLLRLIENKIPKNAAQGETYCSTVQPDSDQSYGCEHCESYSPSQERLHAHNLEANFIFYH